MFRTTPSGELATADDLLRTITDGIYGTPMRGFRDTLTPHQRASVVAYIQRFSADYRDPDLTDLSPIEPSNAPAVDVALGRKTYQRSQCATCHGDTGAGDGPANATLVDDQGRPRPAHDMTRGYLKRGLSRRATYLTLATGLAGTPMPPYRDVLSEAELWALADYVLSLVPERGVWAWLTSPLDRDYPEPGAP